MVRKTRTVSWLFALAVVAWFTHTAAAFRLDHSVAELISDSHGGRMDSLMIGLGDFVRPLYIAPVTMVAAAVLWIRVRRWALLLPTAFGSAIAVTYMVKWLLGRSRPGEEFSLVNLHDAAFPSAHVAAVTSSGLAAVKLAAPVLRRASRRLLQLVVLALIGAVALSRLWVGAHWLTDVIGGLIAGAVGLALALLVLARCGRLP